MIDKTVCKAPFFVSYFYKNSNDVIEAETSLVTEMDFPTWLARNKVAVINVWEARPYAVEVYQKAISS